MFRFQVRVQSAMLDRTQTTTSIMVRDDLPSAGIELDSAKGFAGYPVVLGGNYSYTLAWTTRIPDIVTITADGIVKYVIQLFIKTIYTYLDKQLKDIEKHFDFITF